jgi:hypothetical protein
MLVEAFVPWPIPAAPKLLEAPDGPTYCEFQSQRLQSPDVELEPWWETMSLYEKFVRREESRHDECFRRRTARD